MILKEAQEKKLTKYLETTLEPLTTADPKVLTNFLIQTIKNYAEKTQEELIPLMKEELDDFLQEEATPFVSTLFAWINENILSTSLSSSSDSHFEETKSSSQKSPDENESRKRKYEETRYRSSSRSLSRSRSPSREYSPHYNKRSRRSSPESNRYRHSPRSPQSPRSPRSPMRRSSSRSPDRYYDNRDIDDRRDNFRGYNSQQNRRRYDSYRQNNNPRPDNRNYNPRSQPPNNRRPRYDNNNNNNNNINNNIRRKKNVCRDFDEKGICVRGDTCPFLHVSPVVVDEIPEFQLQQNRSKNDEGSYNPEHPFLEKTNNDSNRPPFGVWPSGYLNTVGQVLGMPQYLPQPGNQDGDPQNFGDDFNKYGKGPKRGRGGNRGNRGRDGGGNRGGRMGIHNNGNLGSNGRNDKRGKSASDTVVVTRIPLELNTMEKLIGHFKKFGTIVNIQIDTDGNKAYVTFTNPGSALKALRSPEAVLENRFIQVYMKHNEGQPTSTITNPQQQPQNVQNQQLPQSGSIVVDNIFDNNLVKSSPAFPVGVNTSLKPSVPIVKSSHVVKPPVGVTNMVKKTRADMLQKQLELLEAVSKLKGASKEKTELMSQLGDITSFIETSLKKEEKNLEGKLPVSTPVSNLPSTTSTSTSMNSTSTSTSLPSPVINSLANGSSDNVSQVPVSSGIEEKLIDAEQLKKKTEEDAETALLTETVAALEKQANELGIDIAAGRGRGRGVPGTVLAPGSVWRGAVPRGRGVRGAPWMRGTRGVRGARGRGRGRGGALKLDNRTTVLKVSGIPDDGKNEASVRQHFQRFGDILSVGLPGGDSVLIQFDSRKSAEIAAVRGNTWQNHTLAMSWQDVRPDRHEPAPGSVENISQNVGSLTSGDNEDEDIDVVEEFDDSFPEYAGEDDGDESDERSWKR